ncbi:YadA family autotransporter adhesin, partial [Psychrobacter sp. I-STPA10]|uniref:YadA family autotransporter adhesin n=1 Tax=Psychrobacter sp. I-STPA10 TaxID=2585769 RepID=UPI001E62BE4A
TGDSNIKTTANSGGVQVALNPVLTGLTSITVTDGPTINGNGINMNGDKITGLKGGKDAGDAVNVSQLNAVKAEASKKTIVKDGKNTTVTSSVDKNGNPIYTVATKDNVNFKTANIGGVSIAKGGITNLNNGTVTATSKDAINGSQLFDTANSVTNVLGGNAVNKNGVVTTTDIGGTGKNTIDEAIKAIDSKAGVKTTVSAGKNITVTKNGNDYKVATSDDVNFTNVSTKNITAKDGNGNSSTMTATGTTVTDKAGNKAQYGASGITITSADNSKAPVSVTASGLNNGGNVISNVGTGKADTDAVNLGQLKQFTKVAGDVKVDIKNIEKNIIGKVDKDGKPAIETYNVANQSTKEGQTIVDAINHMNKEGIKYFHTNGADSNAIKPNGNTQDSSAQAARSTAIGVHATVGKDAADSLALGSNAAVADNAKAAVALGNNAQAKTENSVALGAGSVADKPVTDLQNQPAYGANYADLAGVGKDVAGEFSVGAPNATRRVTNVAAGAAPTDAVNVSQLAAVDNRLTNAINNLGYKVDDVANQANAGISSAMAMAALPQAYLPGKSMISGGIASYNGEGAVAVGISKLSDNGRWVFKMNGSADTEGNAGASAGVGMHW